MSGPTTTTTTEAGTVAKSMDDLVALCKRRGFIYPASEIYGGINGFWDFGPLGTELKNNLRDAWWHDMVRCPPTGPDGHPLSIVGLDSAIIQNPKTWEASGHVAGFNDPMVDDRETKQRFRADHLYGVWIAEVTGTTISPVLDDLRQRIAADLTLQPIVTVIATTESEAAAIFLREAKKLLRLAGTKLRPRGEAATLTEMQLFDDSGRHFVAEIKNIKPDRLANQVVSLPSPFSQKTGTLTEPRQFNLMFRTFVGATSNEDDVAFLRPETAQGIFLNYKNVLDTMRVKVPFGIAQIGKAFRNEVTPRNYIFRSREFEQMEMEWFCHESEARQWYEFWVQARLDWWASVGLVSDNLRRREHDAGELAHYSTTCADVEFRYPFTAPEFGELEGISHRGCYDLSKHQEHAGAKLEYFDQERNDRYLPHVIEPAAGLSRGVLALLCEAYTPDPQRPSKVFMRFHPRMAPIKAAIFPLVNKDGMPEVAEKLYHELRGRWSVQLDVKQNIGKRYARMDEAGTPYCFTIDSETLGDQTVTVRERDTLAQQRIGLDQVAPFLAERISG
ncbi:MAG: glycine--tRNA ligase [Planctomycetota bacterium]|jgi:glycyl-tRNA synthetase